MKLRRTSSFLPSETLCSYTIHNITKFCTILLFLYFFVYHLSYLLFKNTNILVTLFLKPYIDVHLYLKIFLSLFTFEFPFLHIMTHGEFLFYLESHHLHQHIHNLLESKKLPQRTQEYLFLLSLLSRFASASLQSLKYRTQFY